MAESGVPEEIRDELIQRAFWSDFSVEIFDTVGIDSFMYFLRNVKRDFVPGSKYSSYTKTKKIRELKQRDPNLYESLRIWIEYTGDIK